LLRKECVSQIRRPLDIAGHALHHVRKRHQSLDTWVPRLLCHRICQRFAGQILVPIHPLLKLDDFQRISGSSERLSQE
jgi:Zn-dependent peptidase ImmA (M78 family)